MIELTFNEISFVNGGAWEDIGWTDGGFNGTAEDVVDGLSDLYDSAVSATTDLFEWALSS